MRVQMMKAAVNSVIGVIGMAGVAAASSVNVGVEVMTPGVRVSASNVPPPVTVAARERIIVHEKESHHDHGKHKGHYKKHKKHKKHKKQKHHED